MKKKTDDISVFIEGTNYGKKADDISVFIEGTNYGKKQMTLVFS